MGLKCFLKMLYRQGTDRGEELLSAFTIFWETLHVSLPKSLITTSVGAVETLSACQLSVMLICIFSNADSLSYTGLVDLF